jgi:hypothetical protein
MPSRKCGVKKKAIHFYHTKLEEFIKAIKRFFKVENKIGVILNIARRLFHVNLFLQILVKEGGFNIHLMNLPFISSNNG